MKKQIRNMLVPCAVAAFTIGTSMVSMAAVGWTQEGGAWRYYQSAGDAVTETWKKSGSHWFWLDEDGEMATDQLIEQDGDYYYVNESGARVANEWRQLDNDDDSDGASDTCWYYLGANGKAYKASDSGKTSFKTIGKADGSSRRYAFDSQGRMLYGWVSEESELLTEEDSWKEGVYYCGDPDDGALSSNKWVKLEVEDDDQEKDEFDGYYWFYFGTNGKKISDTTKTINGRKYRFAESGNAEFNWYLNASSSNATDSNIFYNDPAQCWQANGWFQAVPGENVDPEAYDNEDVYWFYAQKDGELIKSQIKKINGQYYGFNEYGEMLHGLFKLSVDGRQINSWEEIESTNDLPEENDGWSVYYFGDTPKDGVMKTGTASLEVDGETYSYKFKKSGDERGQGYDGIEDGSIYIKGRMLKADKDSKLEVISYDGNDYLINSSGKIQKKKTNAKDADDRYYCTDSDGIVTYVGNEKWEKEK